MKTKTKTTSTNWYDNGKMNLPDGPVTGNVSTSAAWYKNLFKILGGRLGK